LGALRSGGAAREDHGCGPGNPLFIGEMLAMAGEAGDEDLVLAEVTVRELGREHKCDRPKPEPVKRRTGGFTFR